MKRENELKTLLGISFVDEIKQDFSEGLNQIKSMSAWVLYLNLIFLSFFFCWQQILTFLFEYFDYLFIRIQKAAQTFTDLGSSISQSDT